MEKINNFRNLKIAEILTKMQINDIRNVGKNIFQSHFYYEKNLNLVKKLC